jgi:ATP-dependent DNA helicase RecQ
MPKITFLDTEIDPSNGKILDIGCINEDGGKFHSPSLSDLGEFLNSTEFMCGHNIIDHDKVYLEKWTGKDFTRTYKFIDTLFLSPLLFPEHPYHKLVKDDKLDPENLNNPYIDATKARDLFYELINAFHGLDDPLKRIYFHLLKNSDYFRFFFEIIAFSDETKNLEELIFSYFKQKFVPVLTLVNTL